MGTSTNWPSGLLVERMAQYRWYRSSVFSSSISKCSVRDVTMWNFVCKFSYKYFWPTLKGRSENKISPIHLQFHSNYSYDVSRTNWDLNLNRESYTAGQVFGSQWRSCRCAFAGCWWGAITWLCFLATSQLNRNPRIFFKSLIGISQASVSSRYVSVRIGRNSLKLCKTF